MAVLRRLGVFETCFDLIMPKAEIIYIQTFIVRCDEKLSCARMADGVQAWAMRHPLLRARVDVRPEGRYFVQMDSDDVTGAVRFHEDLSDWVQLGVDEMKKPIDAARGPLWRMNVGGMGGDRHVIVFTVHHAIMDGVNFMTVGLELLTILNGRGSDLPRVDGVLPSVDQLLHNSDVDDGPPPVLHQPWLTPGSKIPASFGDRSNDDCQWLFLPFQLDATVTSRLLQLSQQHGVKLNSTLCCITAIADAMLYAAHDEPISSTMLVHISVNVRRFLNVERHHLGCYATNFYCRALLESSPEQSMAHFWRIAKDMNDNLHGRLEKDVFESLKGDFQTLAQLTSGTPFDVDGSHFLLTNVGAFSHPPVGCPHEVAIDEAYFLCSILPDSWVVPIYNSVTTVNGRLFWSLGYHEKAITTDLARELKGILLSLIHQLTNTDDRE